MHAELVASVSNVVNMLAPGIRDARVVATTFTGRVCPQ